MPKTKSPLSQFLRHRPTDGGGVVRRQRETREEGRRDCICELAAVIENAVRNKKE